MATYSSQRARKEYKCGKCGATINAGDLYYRISERFTAPKFRCSHCQPTRAELTGSDYLRWLYDFQDTLSDTYDLRSEDAKDEIYGELETQRDELQDRLDNMPESLQDSDSGCILQDRISSLEDAMDELDNLAYPDRDDVDVDKDDYVYDPDDETCEYESQEEADEAYESAVDGAFEEALDDYANSIEEAVGNIEG